MSSRAPVSPSCAAPAARTAPAWARVLCLLALAGLAYGFARVGLLFISKGGPDFEYFYKAGANLLHRGGLDGGIDVVAGQVVERGTLDWYFPFVSRVMSIFALLPYGAAGQAWLVLNVAALLGTVWMLGRHVSGLPPRDWAVTQLVPVLLLSAYWFWEFRLNQVNVLTLLLVVGSFTAWQSGRLLSGGFWLGLAVLIKITPALLVFWFLLKRQYRTVAAAAVTFLLAGPLADLVVLRPATAVDAYRSWIHNAVTTGSQTGLVRTQRETDWRNQGFSAVLCRWLHATSYSTRFDNDPRVQADYGDQAPRYLNIVDLPTQTVARLVTVCNVALLGGLAWLARRPAAQLSPWQIRLEWALFVLAMLFFMPIVRRYHVIWALPALSVMAGVVHHAGHGTRWSRLAIAAMLMVGAAQVTLLYRPLEARGTILASLVVLAMPLVSALLRLAREPGWLRSSLPDSTSPIVPAGGPPPAGAPAHG